MKKLVFLILFVLPTFHTSWAVPLPEEIRTYVAKEMGLPVDFIERHITSAQLDQVKSQFDRCRDMSKEECKDALLKLLGGWVSQWLKFD